MNAPKLDELRRYALARSLFPPTTLRKAIERLGFVQADPIRAPARAQDLTLRHRVKGYCAGDLEAKYPRLPIEEDFFINYGFLPRGTQALMHPRAPRKVWDRSQWDRATDVLNFVRTRGEAHPRDVDAHFQHGRTKNWFGGSSSASTLLLDGMHYRGLLRVARRENGVRMYAAAAAHEVPPDLDAAMDVLVDVAIAKYAPLPEPSLGTLVTMLGGGAPQWRDRRKAALARARARLASAVVEGVRWYWPATENPRSTRHRVDPCVRLLAPFDPIVWDRRRFELLWGWSYRFEAYTPAAQRVRGYYALPLLWHEHVVGWANATVEDGCLQLQTGFVSGNAPAGKPFAHALEEEGRRLCLFLGLTKFAVRSPLPSKTPRRAGGRRST